MAAKKRKLGNAADAFYVKHHKRNMTQEEVSAAINLELATVNDLFDFITAIPEESKAKKAQPNVVVLTEEMASHTPPARETINQKNSVFKFNRNEN